MSYTPLTVKYGSVYGLTPSQPLYRGLGQAFGANTWIAPVLGIGAGLFALSVISDAARDLRSNRLRRNGKKRRRLHCKHQWRVDSDGGYKVCMKCKKKN